MKNLNLINSPFCHFVQKIIPLAFDESMSYYECICAFRKYLETTIIPTVNEQTEAITELQNLFTELDNFVKNYLTDKNLQPLINNKLDQFAEDGTLENLIAKFISNNTMLVYPNVESMQKADLKTFQKVKTLGYYTANDGGGAEYLIVASNTGNYHYEELDNGKFAELIIYNLLNPKQLGAYGDNLHDDTLILQKALNFNFDLFFSNGIYLISDTLNFNGKINITFSKNAIIKASTTLNEMFLFNDFENSDISQNCNIINLNLDGNDLVNIGLTLSNYVNLYFENLQINNCRQIGLLTKGQNSRQQAELRITKSCIRNYNYSYSNSIGIKVNSTDGTYNNLSIVDFATSVEINAVGNSFNDIHPWLHFINLWEKSTAFKFNTGGDLVNITNCFVDSIRTAFISNSGLLNISNCIIYYANKLYGDNNNPDYFIDFDDFIINNPVQLFIGTNNTTLRLNNIYAYVQGGNNNIVTNIVNPTNSLSNCLTLPSNNWKNQLIDYSKTINKNIIDSDSIISSYKFCTKTGRLVTLNYRGTTQSSLQGFTTIAYLPFKPNNEIFFLDGSGKKLYISTNGELQNAENIDNNTNLKINLTFLSDLII